MRSVFITGTDTGVGKTVVAAALLTAARSSGVDAVPMKPVQTGCVHHGHRVRAPDLDFALRMSRYRAMPSEEALMCPYPFAPACSPHLAAAMAGIRISTERILYRYARLAARHKAVVVEGAGGVMVPLNEREHMRDLMRRLALPVVLVVRPGLGTLNHSLLSVESIRSAGLELVGLVVAHTEAESGDPRVAADNRSTLRRRTGAEILAVFPRAATPLDDPATFRRQFRRPGRELLRRLA